GGVGVAAVSEVMAGSVAAAAVVVCTADPVWGRGACTGAEKPPSPVLLGPGLVGAWPPPPMLPPPPPPSPRGPAGRAGEPSGPGGAVFAGRGICPCKGSLAASKASKVVGKESDASKVVAAPLGVVEAAMVLLVRPVSPRFCAAGGTNTGPGVSFTGLTSEKFLPCSLLPAMAMPGASRAGPARDVPKAGDSRASKVLGAKMVS